MSAPQSSSPWIQKLSEPASLISALKWGAIVGFAYYVVELLFSYIVVLFGKSANASTNPLLLFPACLGLGAYVFALYISGYMTASERNHVAPGVLSTVIMLVIARILQSIYNPAGQANIATGTIVVQIVSLILALSIAIALGWLGAFYGVKHRTQQQKKAAGSNL